MPELARRLEPKMAVHHFAVAPDQHGILKPNSRIDAHMRSTAASFLRGLRGYSRRRSIGQISICWAGGDEIIVTE